LEIAKTIGKDAELSKEPIVKRFSTRLSRQFRELQNVANKTIKNQLADWITLVLGLAALGFSISQFPLHIMDVGFAVFTLFTIFFSSSLQIQLPRTKLYFTISDTLIFIAILLYSGEAAVVLATVESLVTSLIFKRKGIKIRPRTMFLNGAVAAVTTFATVYLLRFLFGSVSEIAASGSVTDFAKILSTMALAQFFFNSLFISVLGAHKDNKSVWKIWYEHCLNALIIYIAGAVSAGFFTKAFQHIEPFLIVATFSFSAVVYLFYRRSMNDIKETAAKAEQAERERTEQAENHILVLRHYISEQERIGQELRESRERFRHAAFHDSLTNLPNRNLFIRSLNTLLEKSKKSPERKFAVLFLDLNRFKTVNDSLGHSAGDRLILNVAKRLSGLLREGDLVARFSGDEFGIILNSISNVDDALQFAETVRRKLLTPFTINGRQVFTSISVGIAVSNLAYAQAEDLLRDADIAMYYAKERNKNYVVFDQTMHTRAVTLLQLETDLRHAVENDELIVYYQPIINLATMELTGFEALMRWNHPQRGLVPPNEFIPVAEETNYIVPLTLWILQKSCRQLIEWQNRSPLNKNLVMSVNLSGKHFAQPDIVEQIRWIIKETGVKPSCLKLEITESAIMENAESTIAMLKNLRLLGVQLSIDDFGTGYSSLSYLHRFPIDLLKVDRSFVGSMEDGTENGEIVRTIISLAKTLNLSVVAEGIESIHQLHQLQILGCEYGQGYLFSRPVPAEEAQTILDDRTRWQTNIPKNTPPIITQKTEYTHLGLLSN
jgi:diguanylate cyclase (GGDEF)-like protein